MNASSDKFRAAWLVRNDNRNLTEPEYDGAELRPPRRGPSANERRREEAIADLVGTERAVDVIASLRPEPMQISELIDAEVEKLRGKGMAFIDKLRRQWTEVMGDKAAAVTYASHIADEKLVIEVSNQSWLYLLKMNPVQTKEIERRVLALAGGCVNGITFVGKGRFKR